MASTIIKALEEYFCNCELLSEGRLRVDYLGDKPVEYNIEVLTCDPILKRYVGGDTVRQYLFAFGSREYYSQERLQNIANSAFYETFAEWVEKQNEAKNLPELPSNMEALELHVTSSGYLFGDTKSTARYQINLQLVYYKEAITV